MCKVAALVAVAASFGCTHSAPAPQPAGVQERGGIGAQWGPGCNDSHLKRGLWSLDRATDFEISRQARARVDQVISEVEGGYGGTLVTSPPDEVIDSPAFLAHYLRAFSRPPDMTSKGLQTYDYRFERILSRIAGAPRMIEDPNLDWDIWRAYLEYENCLSGSNDYSNADAALSSDCAKDLLWSYLEYNFDAIRANRPRLNKWIDWITTDLHAPGGRPLRRWFLLLLTSLTDEVTPKLVAEQESRDSAKEEEFAKSNPGCMLVPRWGSAWNPFVVVYPNHKELDPEDPAPPFPTAIRRIAREHGLTYAVLGLDPSRMPATRNWEVDLAERAIESWINHVLDQDSWSTKHYAYRVNLYRPIGRRSSYSNVHLPRAAVTDGVYFFTFRGRLYVWPKSRMDDAAIDMLRLSGLIGDDHRKRFAAEGFDPLQVTLQGP